MTDDDETAFPTDYEYALARSCGQCKAAPGTVCDAPRKDTSLRQLDDLLQQRGADPAEHDPTHRIHISRLDAGIRHRTRDIAQAPDREDRIAGRSYGTLGQLPTPRKRRAIPPDADLFTRAAAVLGGTASAVKWPYGLSNPQRRRASTPAAYEELQRKRRTAQETITAWAETYGLRLSSSDCCPRWLQRSVSRRCTDGQCRYDAPAADAGWLDHSTFWLLDGAPAVLASAPYAPGPEDNDRLRWWAKEDPRLRTARGEGWYGYGTTQILMWRSDILDFVVPAVSAPAHAGNAEQVAVRPA
ncbi:hypothetical protein [Streptomyces sp. AC154]|uniref:hypothetical protein n=1 Tax=Streptomyces sp. AC154 TaxID=3143184 RepID=UPI003F7F6221